MTQATWTGPVNPEPDRRSKVRETRTCPDCGRPQHYTGTEYGWAHDALVDTWHCADPRKADAADDRCYCSEGGGVIPHRYHGTARP